MAALKHTLCLLLLTLSVAAGQSAGQCTALSFNSTWPQYMNQVAGATPSACTVQSRARIYNGNILAIDSQHTVYYGDYVRGIISVTSDGSPATFLGNVTSCSVVGPLGCYIANFSGSSIIITAFAWGSQASLLFYANVTSYISCDSDQCFIDFVAPNLLCVANSTTFALFSAATGEYISAFSLEGEATNEVIIGSATYASGVLPIVGGASLSGNRSLYAVNITTGAVLWTFNASLLVLGLEPIAMSGLIVVATGQYPSSIDIIALNPVDGTQTWSAFNTNCIIQSITVNCLIICLSPPSIGQPSSLFSLSMTMPPLSTPLFTYSTGVMQFVYVDTSNTAVLTGYPNTADHLDLFAVNVVAPQATSLLWSVRFAPPAGSPAISTSIFSASDIDMVAVAVLNLTAPVAPSPIAGGVGSLYFLGGKGTPCPAILPII